MFISHKSLFQSSPFSTFEALRAERYAETKSFSRFVSDLIELTGTPNFASSSRRRSSIGDFKPHKAVDQFSPTNGCGSLFLNIQEKSIPFAGLSGSLSTEEREELKMI
ncbi:hypothetical protein SCA6_007075 [Theobroma cacao]